MEREPIAGHMSVKPIERDGMRCIDLNQSISIEFNINWNEN